MENSASNISEQFFINEEKVNKTKLIENWDKALIEATKDHDFIKSYNGFHKKYMNDQEYIFKAIIDKDINECNTIIDTFKYDNKYNKYDGRKAMLMIRLKINGINFGIKYCANKENCTNSGCCAFNHTFRDCDDTFWDCIKRHQLFLIDALSVLVDNKIINENDKSIKTIKTTSYASVLTNKNVDIVEYTSDTVNFAKDKMVEPSDLQLTTLLSDIENLSLPVKNDWSLRSVVAPYVAQSLANQDTTPSTLFSSKFKFVIPDNIFINSDDNDNVFEIAELYYKLKSKINDPVFVEFINTYNKLKSKVNNPTLLKQYLNIEINMN